MVNSYYNEQDWLPQHAGTDNHQDNWTPPSKVKMPHDVTKKINIVHAMYTTEKFTTDKFTTNVSFYNIFMNKAISFTHKKFTILFDGIKIQLVFNLVYFDTWIQIMFMLMLIINSVGAQSFYIRLTRLLVKIINNNKNHDLQWFLLCQIMILYFAGRV